MAWVQETVDGGEAGLIPTGLWRNTETGEISATPPAMPSGIETYTIDNPGAAFEGQGGTSMGFKINGTPYDQFQTTYSGTGPNGRAAAVTSGPNGTERSYFVQTPSGPLILPESIAKAIDPNAIPYEQTADGGYGGLGGLLDQYITPALMAGVGAAGAFGLGGGGAAGFGSAGVPDAVSTFGGGSFGTGATGAAPLMPPAISPSTAGYTAAPFTSASGVPATEYTLSNIGEAAAGMGLPAVGGGSLLTTLAEKLGPTAAKSLFDKFTNGEISSSDLMRLAGSLGGAALGAYEASQQADAYKALADKYMGFGEPSRARYEATFQPGFSMMSDPGYKDALDQTAKGILHGLSTSGNPADSPNAWAQSLSDLNAKFAYPALQDYRRTNAAGGGLTSLASAAPAAAGNAIQSQGGVYNAIGSAAADIFNPPTTLTDLVRQLQGVKYA